MHLLQRYQQLRLGREEYISNPSIPDGLNPQSYNRYSYCINNPMKYIDPSGMDYLLIGGSGLDKEEMLKWKDRVIEEGMVAEGEEVYILKDNDPENVVIHRFDVDPRLERLDQWLSNPTDLDGKSVKITVLKLIAHSEGAATTGVYMDKYLDGSSGISQHSRELLDSQLRGVFLVDCITGISAIKGANYTYRDIENVGYRLGKKR